MLRILTAEATDTSGDEPGPDREEASCPGRGTGTVLLRPARIQSTARFPHETLTDTRYDAADIEVLSGLEPVRKRPGMYTDTSRPNHLAQEVLDNSVDEALAGFAAHIVVTLHRDASLSVADDGRGMPVDIHPEEGVPGVELILTRLHAGAKFSERTYRFSGGLHGVGVSAVNALSKHLEVWIKRGGQEYNMSFANGEKQSELEPIDTVGRRNTGTRLRFWPDPRFFDSPRFSVGRLKHTLRAKAVLCPGLNVSFCDDATGEQESWHYEEGLSAYLLDWIADLPRIPDLPFDGSLEGGTEAVDWSVCWLPDGGEAPNESYVNLVPTPLGGTHVNGFRTGLLEAVREYCEFRSLLPRGVKLAPDDVWEHVAYVLSVKMVNPQFTGQTKDRLSSRECATFVSGTIKNAFGLWLSQHPETGDQIAELALQSARRRLHSAKKVVRKKVTVGPGPAGQARRLHLPGCLEDRAVSRGGRLRRWVGQAGEGPRVPGGDALARQDPEYLGSRCRRGAAFPGGARHFGGGRSGARSSRPLRVALRQGLHPRRCRFRRRAYRVVALRDVRPPLPTSGRGRARMRRDAAAVSHRYRQRSLLRARRR